MPPRISPVLRTAALAAVLLAATVAPAAPAAAEDPTPQAINAHAEFLAYPNTPPPPAPVKVCVVDTGVDLTTDAASAVVERYSEFGGTVDDTGGGGIAKHGTYVAGVIASQLDGRGSVGIWPRARIVSVRVFPDRDSGTTVARYLHALNICRDAGAKVVNLSLSGLGSATGPELAQLENKIVNLRVNFGTNVVAAAGNNGGEIGFPAKFSDVFAVGANDSAGSFCDFSSRGPELDISTLGCGLLLSLSDGGLGVGSGTSYAAPVVSGALGALRAYRPDLSAVAAEQLLTTGARTAGAGRVLDIAGAFHAAGLDSVLATPPPVAPSATPVASPAITVMAVQDVAAPMSSDPMAELGVARPRVRISRYRRGVLTVVVSGVPDFGRAVFTIDNHRYARRSGKLRLKLRRPPKRARVLIDVPGVGQTNPVTIKVKRDGSRVRRHPRG